MVHKKAILAKFINDSSSSDCRSPIHNGMTWLIPETSPSSENENNSQEEDPGQMSNYPAPPTRSRNDNITSNPPAGDSRNTEQPVNKSAEDPGNPKNSSSSSRGNFLTDNSPLTSHQSPNQGIINSSGSTLAFLGTSAHPITVSSETGTPGSDKSIPLITPPSSRPTEIGNSSEVEDLDETIIITSTPVHSDPPPLRMSDMDTQSGDTFSIPSEIFGSPERENAGGNNTKSPQQSPCIVDMNQAMNISSSSSDTSDAELDKALQAMKKSLAHAQKMKKRTFFQTALKGMFNLIF